MTLGEVLIVIAAIESGGDYAAYNAKEEAVGLLQIRQCVLDDVNRVYGASYHQTDCFSRLTSAKIAKQYIYLWCNHEKVGRSVTVADAVRIWNGGPTGWAKDSTRKYLEKFMKEAVNKGHNKEEIISAIEGY